MEHKAQSMIEYVVLLAAVISAILAMQLYYRRSINGNIRTRADQLSDGLGYAPGQTNGVTVTRTSIHELSTSNDDASASTMNYHQEVDRSESVRPF